MSDLKVVFLHDPADQAWADKALAALTAGIAAQIATPGDRPVIEVRADLTAWPRATELGPLSMIVLALPGRPFTTAEEASIRAFLDRTLAGAPQILPVAPDATRAVPPPPLDHLVSARLHSPSNSGEVAQVTTHLLNQMILRVAGRQRRVFISYRARDGKDIAEYVEQGLIARGYQVWRDELLDRDGLPSIKPGSPAQQTIERAIVEQGFILVIDTPEAPQSPWVEEEVNLAIAHMLPVLPLVVEDVIGRRPPLGGRFHQLAAFQRETRRGHAALSAHNLPSVLDEAFFSELETAMASVLIGHLQTRRRLLHETERGFRALHFSWQAIDPERLLFCADLDCDSSETPHAAVRLLVQCSPYATVLDRTVGGLAEAFPRQVHHHQFGVLVHQADVYGGQRRELLRDRGGHLLVLRSSELDILARVLHLPTVTVSP